MKSGRSLQELALEITRQQESKKDYIARVGSNIRFNTAGNLMLTGVSDNMEMSQHAHKQLGDYVGIPRKYYQKLQGHSTDLLSRNVNTWLSNGKRVDKRMIRTLDGKARAFLSSRYRILDNHDMMEAVLPTILENEGDIKIASCDITDRKLYLKCLFPKIEGEVTKGDAVQSGIVISNSEIGGGGLKVQPLLYRLICTNGMIMNDSSLNKFHIGRNLEVNEGVEELLTDETKEQNDRAFWMTVRDVVKASYSQAFFNDQLLKLREAADIQIESAHIEKVVEVSSKKMGFGQEVQESVLQRLVNGRDFTKYGLSNAYTNLANDTECYETATSLEMAGGEIINMNSKDWKSISLAS